MSSTSILDPTDNNAASLNTTLNNNSSSSSSSDKLASAITQFLLEIIPNSIVQALVSLVALVIWLIGLLYLAQLIDKQIIPKPIASSQIWINGGKIPLQAWIIASCILSPIVSISWPQLTNYIGILAGVMIATFFFLRLSNRWLLLTIALLTILTNSVALFYDVSSISWLQTIIEWSSILVIILALADILILGTV